MKNKVLTVIDFFCWAGWFSEWFRQQGFKVIQGIDYWQPAIDTHNLNHGLNDTTKSVLDFWLEDTGDVIEIEKLEDTDCIIGSPPCVSFSSSNKSWKADKTLWIALIQAYLRVIAVKKHKPWSKLMVWYMENVPNSKKYVKEFYTFADLNLNNWAKRNWKKPSDIALNVKNEWDILNSWDYWAPQSRLRFVAGEWCKTWKFLHPEKTHIAHVTLGNIIDKLPPPNSKINQDKLFHDPNYPEIIIPVNQVTDYFYDTGIYEIEWEESKYLKENHSYMGKMSFPENKNRPCRTIMATRSAKTREALIYKSEYNRKWDGEYRVPTIREIACLMGFPITYQFSWSESTKWRQIWNAVSPHLSSSLAKAIRNKLWLPRIKTIDFPSFETIPASFINLNTFTEKKFLTPPVRKENARFRRHAIKSWNLTIELQNYLTSNDIPGKKWYIVMYFGTGIGFWQQVITKRHYNDIVTHLTKNDKDFLSLKSELDLHLVDLNVGSSKFQELFEKDLLLSNSLNPINILHTIKSIIEKLDRKDIIIKNIPHINKSQIPAEQIYILYILGKFIF